MSSKPYGKKVAWLSNFSHGVPRLGAVFITCALLASSTEATTITTSNLSFVHKPNISVNSLQNTVTGKVVDSNGAPIAGVLISVKGSVVKSVTSSDGSFSIQAKVGDVLVLTHVSYFVHSTTVTKSRDLIITLEQNENLVEEVVVTGYTDYSKNKSASASTQVAAKDINHVPMISMDQILQGRVPGLSVSSSSGQPGMELQLKSRDFLCY